MAGRGSFAQYDDLAAPEWVDGALSHGGRRSGRAPGARASSSASDRSAARRAAARTSRTREAAPDAAATREGPLGEEPARTSWREQLTSAQTAGRLLLFATVVLLLFGLVMAYSSSTAQGYFAFGSSWYFLKKQLLFAGIGVVLLIVVSRIDYRLWRKLAAPLAAVVAFLLLLVAVPGIGATINGARRWLEIGGFTLQPSEFAKPAAILLAAALIVGSGAPVTTFKGFLRVIAVALLPLAALIMVGKDLSTTMVLTLAIGAVLITAGARWRHLIGVGVLIPAVAALLIYLEPYRTARLTAFLDPWAHSDTSGFQTTQSLISVASGQVFGVGLGNSVQKFGFLPEQTTDMITGIIGEELGLMGLLVLIALYGLLAWAGFMLALSCRDRFARLVCAGLTTAVVGQALLNLGAAMGLVPILGVPLPLVSMGGTSLIAVLAGVGIMLNIASNRRSRIGVSPERRRSGGGGRRDRRPHGAGAGGR